MAGIPSNCTKLMLVRIGTFVYLTIQWNWATAIDPTYTEVLEKFLGFGVDLEHAALGVLYVIEGRNFGNVLIFSFSLFLLELEGDTADGSALDALHKMGGIAGNLRIPESPTVSKHSG